MFCVKFTYVRLWPRATLPVRKATVYYRRYGTCVIGRQKPSPLTRIYYSWLVSFHRDQFTYPALSTRSRIPAFNGGQTAVELSILFSFAPREYAGVNLLKSLRSAEAIDCLVGRECFRLTVESSALLTELKTCRNLVECSRNIFEE